MKYSKRRRINTILGLIPLLVLMFSIVGGVTYAIVTGTRSSTNHGFKVNVRGAVNVSASIKGTSYLNTTEKETFTTTVNGETVTGTTNFSTPLDIDTAEDKVSFLFEITNTTNEAKFTDLIIEPSYTLVEADNVISTMYYSINGEDYDVLTDKYLIAHKTGKVYVKLIVEITEINQAYTDNNSKVNINLYTEDGLPTDFEYDKEYSVVDDVAYVKELCPTCASTHKEATAMKAGTYIVVNKDNVQAILDGYYNGEEYDINNKTIVFSEGIYGHLQLRATRYAVDHIYSYDEENPNIVGEELDYIPTSTDYGTYHYERAFNNITFAGTANAKFEGLFVVWSESNNAKFPSTIGLADSSSTPWEDKVRETLCTNAANTKIEFIQHISMNNIVFDKMNFSGPKGRIEIRNNTTNDGIKNITVQNCTFITSEAYVGFNEWFWEGVAISMKNSLNNTELKVVQNFENIVIKNNIINGHYQGLYIQNSKNVEIYDNEISNTVHNFIAIQSVDNVSTIDTSSTKYFSGKIIIKNNTLKNATDRAVRFGNGYNAEVVFANNIIENATDPDDRVSFVKTSTLTNTKFTFINNTYGDEATRQIIRGNATSYVFKSTDLK